MWAGSEEKNQKTVGTSSQERKIRRRGWRLRERMNRGRKEGRGEGGRRKGGKGEGKKEEGEKV